MVEFVQDIGHVAGLVIEVLRDMVSVIFGASPRFIEMSETTTAAGTKIQHIFQLLSVIMLVPETIGMVIKAFRGTSTASVGESSWTLSTASHRSSPPGSSARPGYFRSALRSSDSRFEL